MRTTSVPTSLSTDLPGRHRGARGGSQKCNLREAPAGQHRDKAHRKRHRAVAAAAITAGLIVAPALTSSAMADSYTVRSGDTLSEIAQQHGTSWRTLYRLNRRSVSTPGRIFVGQSLEMGGTTTGRDAQPTRGSSSVMSSGSFGQRVLAAAGRVKGVPYIYGGSSPDQGFDCSGFTSYVFAQAGRTIPRTSGAQAAAAQRISASQLRPGDLVFFRPSGQVSHVAIYAGNGMVWEAPSSGRAVRYAPMWNVSRFYGRI